MKGFFNSKKSLKVMCINRLKKPKYYYLINEEKNIHWVQYIFIMKTPSKQEIDENFLNLVKVKYQFYY